MARIEDMRLIIQEGLDKLQALLGEADTLARVTPVAREAIRQARNRLAQMTEEGPAESNDVDNLHTVNELVAMGLTNAAAGLPEGHSHKQSMLERAKEIRASLAELAGRGPKASP